MDTGAFANFQTPDQSDSEMSAEQLLWRPQVADPVQLIEKSMQ